ncbi:hypothetical protein Poly30_03780 [Planctomycetes bacterium Poly30]|uniref:Uncharacterized protein n=1 Tax=Saltatorellus ferox TaxID=2528018 RepID=A0A518ELC0_9BACT|nr:hypothetical protein Poly30_03780 [Planctomycetes bacterium Poly30]
MKLTQPRGLAAAIFLTTVVLLAAACASPAPAPAAASAAAPDHDSAVPPVWAVGADRLLELDPDAKIPTNILPMYGQTDRSQWLVSAADKQFIAQTSAAFGGRESASEVYAQKGLKFYLEDQYEMAMKRLNQAWLLDETNPDVFYGFACVYQDHQNYLEAGDFAATSIELGQEHPVRMADCAFLIAAQAGARVPTEGVPSQAEIVRIQDQLRPLFARALATAAPSDRGYVQLQAFKTQVNVADYEEAWRSADALEGMGEKVPDTYRATLEKHSPSGQR